MFIFPLWRVVSMTFFFEKFQVIDGIVKDGKPIAAPNLELALTQICKKDIPFCVMELNLNPKSFFPTLLYSLSKLFLSRNVAMAIHESWKSILSQVEFS